MLQTYYALILLGFISLGYVMFFRNPKNKIPRAIVVR